MDTTMYERYTRVAWKELNVYAYVITTCNAALFFEQINCRNSGDYD